MELVEGNFLWNTIHAGTTIGTIMALIAATGILSSKVAWLVGRFGPLKQIGYDELATIQFQPATAEQWDNGTEYDYIEEAELAWERRQSEQTASEAPTASQTPVPAPTGVTIPSDVLTQAQSLAQVVEESRQEATRVGDAEWLRNILALRDVLAENTQAVIHSGVNGVVPEPAVEAYVTNLGLIRDTLDLYAHTRHDKGHQTLRVLGAFLQNKKSELETLHAAQEQHRNIQQELVTTH